MSLAEPKKKQVIGPNPRGGLFTKDTDNRGRSMLTKMGWKDGEGLGIQKQGINQPIKPKVQTDSKGLGFSRKDEPWMGKTAGYSSILGGLSAFYCNTTAKSEVDSNESTEPEPDAVEGPVDWVDVDVEGDTVRFKRILKNRVARAKRGPNPRYQKTVKNLYLRTATEQDLSAVMGFSVVKSLQTTATKRKHEAISSSDESSTESDGDVSSPITKKPKFVTSTVSSADYYKDKMKIALAKRHSASVKLETENIETSTSNSAEHSHPDDEKNKTDSNDSDVHLYEVHAPKDVVQIQTVRPGNEKSVDTATGAAPGRAIRVCPPPPRISDRRDVETLFLSSCDLASSETVPAVVVISDGTENKKKLKSILKTEAKLYDPIKMRHERKNKPRNEIQKRPRLSFSKVAKCMLFHKDYGLTTGSFIGTVEENVNFEEKHFPEKAGVDYTFITEPPPPPILNTHVWFDKDGNKMEYNEMMNRWGEVFLDEVDDDDEGEGDDEDEDSGDDDDDDDVQVIINGKMSVKHPINLQFNTFEHTENCLVTAQLVTAKNEDTNKNNDEVSMDNGEFEKQVFSEENYSLEADKNADAETFAGDEDSTENKTDQCVQNTTTDFFGDEIQFAGSNIPNVEGYGDY